MPDGRQQDLHIRGSGRPASAGKKLARLNVNVSANNNLLCVLAWGDEGVEKPNNANKGANVATQNVVS